MNRLTSIEITGKCFAEPTKLTLFLDKKAEGERSKVRRIACVYGRNGSGKTTISEGIRLATMADGSFSLGTSQNELASTSSGVVVRFLGGVGTALDSGQIFRGHTYVFNEAYVAAHVRDRSSDLESIVLLDEGGEFTDQIEELKSQKADLERAVNSLEEQVAMYDSSVGEKSVPAAQEAAISVLKGNDAWADREKRIKRGSRNSSATSSVFDEIRQLSLPEESLAALLQEFNEKLTTYLDLSDPGAWTLPAAPTLESLGVYTDWDSLQPLLAQRIDQPELTERDERIIEIVSAFGSPFVTNAVGLLRRRERAYCPYCLRDIDENEVADLAARVERVLDDKVKAHQAALDDQRLQNIGFDMSAYSGRFSAQVLEVSNCIAAYNAAVASLAEQVKRKRDNVYEPIVLEENPLAAPLGPLSAALGRLSDAVTDFNTSLAAIDASRDELLSLNKTIARIEMDPALKTWSKLKGKRASAAAQLAEQRATLNQVAESLAALEAKKNSIKVACDLINRNLAFIFMDKEHLQLREAEGAYVLYTHGSPVHPDTISTGERNAVALCYFFASIGTGKLEAERFAGPCFLVVDDPITSFDHENKLGIHAFLQEQLARVLRDNASSKVLLLTHDAQAMSSFGKYQLGCEAVFSELKDCELSSWSNATFDYTAQLKFVYDYARTGAAQSRPFVGNVARKVLEAFGTFEFKEGLLGLYTKGDVLDNVEDDQLRNYFRNHLGRLVLNEESHSQEATEAEASILTLNRYSDEELRRVAQTLICLMYAINPSHVLSHLKSVKADSEESVESVIEGWVNDIKSLY